MILIFLVKQIINYWILTKTEGKINLPLRRVKTLQCRILSLPVGKKFGAMELGKWVSNDLNQCIPISWPEWKSRELFNKKHTGERIMVQNGFISGWMKFANLWSSFLIELNFIYCFSLVFISLKHIFVTQVGSPFLSHLEA